MEGALVREFALCEHSTLKMGARFTTPPLALQQGWGRC